MLVKAGNIRSTKTSSPEVVKLVDAVDSKSTVRDDVSVRVRPSGPYLKTQTGIKGLGFLLPQLKLFYRVDLLIGLLRFATLLFCLQAG